jgi:dynein heavy chain
MDERHWWIAQRISQTFNVNLQHLESFICDEDTLNKINNFLGLNGANKLFFYRQKDELIDSKINAIDSLLKLPKAAVPSNDSLIILYFLRYNTTNDVHSSQISKEIQCGEIKNASQIIYHIYNDLFLPLFKANKDWGDCNDETKTQIILNMDKYVNNIGTIIQENKNARNLVKSRVFHSFGSQTTIRAIYIHQPTLTPTRMSKTVFPNNKPSKLIIFSFLNDHEVKRISYVNSWENSWIYVVDFS